MSNILTGEPLSLDPSPFPLLPMAPPVTRQQHTLPPTTPQWHQWLVDPSDPTALGGIVTTRSTRPACTRRTMAMRAIGPNSTQKEMFQLHLEEEWPPEYRPTYTDWLEEDISEWHYKNTFSSIKRNMSGWKLVVLQQQDQKMTLKIALQRW